jgi:hypothetical protein
MAIDGTPGDRRAEPPNAAGQPAEYHLAAARCPPSVAQQLAGMGLSPVRAERIAALAGDEGREADWGGLLDLSRTGGAAALNDDAAVAKALGIKET